MKVMFKQIGKFILQLILFLISWIIKLPIEIITFFVVLFKYRNGLTYFDNKGKDADVRSARENRALWNWLIVTKNGERFKKDGDKTISRLIGINYDIIGKIRPFGFIMYWFLFIVDFSTWFKGGHCKASIHKEDYKNETN